MKKTFLIIRIIMPLYFFFVNTVAFADWGSVYPVGSHPTQPGNTVGNIINLVDRFIFPYFRGSQVPNKEIQNEIKNLYKT